MTTRLALLSDVHGNAVAFDAMLDDLRGRGVDKIVCLGDMLQGGAQPDLVADRLRALGSPVVLGNADAFLLDPGASTEVPTPDQLAARDWTNERLGVQGADLIRTFRPTIELDVGGGTLLAFHGSPRDFDEVLLPTDGDESFAEKLGEVSADVLTGGHVHQQYVRRVGDATFVNPGSVGLGYDPNQDPDDFHFDPFAAYALVSLDPLEVTFRRVPFEREEVIAALRESGIPIADELVSRWTAA